MMNSLTVNNCPWIPWGEFLTLPKLALDLREAFWGLFFFEAQSSEKNISDDQCIRLVAKGEEEPFQILFQRYGSLVLGTCCRYLVDKATAEDASQEIWVKVVQGAKGFKGQGQCRAWILQITRNTCISLLRKKRIPTTEIDEDFDSPESPEAEVLEVLTQRQDRQVLKQWIEDLPANQRIALVMRLSEEASYEDIAKAIKSSVPSVKSLIFRARRTLKSQWEARNG